MSIPAVMQGYGGQLYLIRGGQVDIVNKSLSVQDITLADYKGIVDTDSSAASDYHRFNFGGRNTWFPAGYANHKPMAFLGFGAKSRLFQALNRCRDTTSALFIGGWDGSGIFTPKGSELDSWRAGRGFDLISPSGSTAVETRDHALIRHNDSVFGIGYHLDSPANPATNPWNTELGWNFSFENLGDLDPADAARTYRVFVLEANGKKTMTPVYRIKDTSNDALNREHMNSCDAFSFKDDIYYANWIDVLRFPGASGFPQIMFEDRNNPRARMFGTWPSGGFTGAGVKVGEGRLLMLESDGNLYRLKAPSSGRDLIVDLTDVRANENGRTGDNVLTRIGSAVNEPGRPPLLLPFNNELHAFVITQTSGYMHFTCIGDPSGTSNWTDRTDELPTDIRRNDSCVYGFVDTVRQKLNFLQVAYSAYGLFGAPGGGQNSGGGFWLYTHDINRVWNELERSIIGMPPRGLVPYQNLGPFAAVPSGNNPEVLKCSDFAILTYNLFDETARTVNVDVEYSIDFGVTWNSARRFKSYDTKTLLGSGVQNLITSPNGVEYTFFWDFVNDVGFDQREDALLRIRPRLVR